MTGAALWQVSKIVLRWKVKVCTSLRPIRVGVSLLAFDQTKEKCGYIFTLSSLFMFTLYIIESMFGWKKVIAYNQSLLKSASMTYVW